MNKKNTFHLLSALLLTALCITFFLSAPKPAYAASVDGVENFVNRCYEVAFQRTPDKGGFD
ncbi:MAG: hypothetical protein K6F84_04395 [Lachnospiraceae bacterium]|nr:hypothetical protein [Lachnospiraceae bacterium]